jgi:hypothetical protein
LNNYVIKSDKEKHKERGDARGKFTRRTRNKINNNFKYTDIDTMSQLGTVYATKRRRRNGKR